MSVARKWALKILATAGIEENGSQPWDIQVHNTQALLAHSDAGLAWLGESYMDGCGIARHWMNFLPGCWVPAWMIR